jgi:hemerythrin superfamily protein
MSSTDIFDRLKADHDKHRSLLSRIDGASAAERQALFEEFTVEVKGHAAAEEQALYSTMMRKPPLTSEVRHSVAEHKELEDLLDDAAAAGDGEWQEKYGALKHRYLHHIEEEEEEMFPQFAEVLTDEDAVFMRKVFEARKPVEKDKAEVTPQKLEDKDD